MPSRFDRDSKFNDPGSFRRFVGRNFEYPVFLVVFANNTDRGELVASALDDQDFEAVIGLMTRNNDTSAALDKLLDPSQEKLVKVQAFDADNKKVDIPDSIIGCLKAINDSNEDVDLQFPGDGNPYSVIE
ncbi:hypothetical protein IW152_002716 [Coemansia sp. BCRC 34962]|nr:hypothetical protein IW152_002716 [Coemansia sp. BCRC 34962]